MVEVSLAEARNNIEALLERVERGEEVLIKGKREAGSQPTAKISMSDLMSNLEAKRRAREPWRKKSAELIREMRDEGC